MGIQQKIENIRNKPENIRMRYVWGYTIFFTALVVVVWFLSLAAQRNANREPLISEDQKKLFEDFGTQKKSLQDTTGQMKGALEGIKDQKNLDNSQNNAEGEGFSQ
ncbi:MAG: hypothetical protein A2288_03890 [Candidatus Moranbacteria bacterium RIFOXYA12_FULL_44_15]|nr:MAG: hypothetical protein A2288_03890 [Candidatus Moranbacteria bacterium RIFOXYA12_FULL_44_15]OGI35107.1 MAG: hypothetical protein A2259_03895 [Candidatus Moranbacteria bacterium RIFOXYA2_FULL_43_15]